MVALVLATLVLSLTALPAAAAASSLTAASPLTTASPLTAASSRLKVVIVVGPVGAQTDEYIADARRLAGQARSYGATVVEIYSPLATWSRVRTATRGANVLIYLGHGNGSPSPYAGGQESHNGLGLNASAGGSNANVRYYGERWISRYIRLAPNAVVVLNHLCYASGNNEWGQGNPTKSVAIRRVDNYGEGFLRAGAAAVFAEGIASPRSILANLFRPSRTTRTIRDIFWASPNATRTYAISFSSRNVPGATALMDPYAPNRYYRSVIGRLSTTVADWR